MLASLRSALLLCAALGATTVAPAQADPSNELLGTVAAASLPEVAVPDLLDPDGEPQLAGPGAHEQEAVTPDNDQPDVAPVHPSGDLATLVADLRGSDAGSRELECLATGVYFEAKSEPLAGQLAVGQVIANRADSGGRQDQEIAARTLFSRPVRSGVANRLSTMDHASRSSRFLYGPAPQYR